MRMSNHLSQDRLSSCLDLLEEHQLMQKLGAQFGLQCSLPQMSSSNFQRLC